MKFVQLKGNKKIKPFEMKVTQVTQKEWFNIMKNNPSYFKGDNLPIEQVSWNDCQEFIKKLNEIKDGYTYRLPTEIEWEYACRAGSKTDYYYFGNKENKLYQYAWFYKNSENKTHEVAQLKRNKFGLYDMHGNVWEWCEDFYDASGSIRVIRGGSWDNLAQFLRSAQRFKIGPDSRFNNVGFRLVRTKLSSKLLYSNTLDSNFNKKELLNYLRKEIKGYESSIDAMKDKKLKDIDQDDLFVIDIHLGYIFCMQDLLKHIQGLSEREKQLRIKKGTL